MRHFLLIVVFVFAFMEYGWTQKGEQKTIYFSSGGELIFSQGIAEFQGEDLSGAIRFSPVFNIQSLVNYDPTDHIGFFGGWAIRNVGFIYDVPASMKEGSDNEGLDIRKKVRTYNLGIPVGFKVGNMNTLFLYGGYEIEIPFLYKEKTFVNDDKREKHTDWFSNRIEPFQHSLFVGIQFPYGMNVKFKYYLSEFFKQDKVKELNASDRAHDFYYYYPDKVNIFYISLNFSLFRNKTFYYKNFHQREHHYDMAFYY